MATTGSGSSSSSSRGSASARLLRQVAEVGGEDPRGAAASRGRRASAAPRDSSVDQSNLGRRLARLARAIEPVADQPQRLGRGAAHDLALVAQASGQARDRRLVADPSQRPAGRAAHQRRFVAELGDDLPLEIGAGNVPDPLEVADERRRANRCGATRAAGRAGRSSPASALSGWDRAMRARSGPTESRGTACETARRGSRRTSRRTPAAGQAARRSLAHGRIDRA